MKTTMYVMTHKKFDCPKIDGYVPLHVGKEGKEDIGYLGDNTGESISIKNPNYCELTGIYWLWKNKQDSDIIGISHYRRYFTKQHFFRNPKYFLNKKYIEKSLEKYDIILPKREIYKESANEQYCLESGFIKDLNIIREIISEKYPQYLNVYDKVMNQNLMHQFNMLVCTKKVYDEYCTWLFDILFNLEQKIDLNNGYNDYQKRIYGFLSERLLNVWVYHNKLKIKKVRVVNLAMTKKDIIRLNLRRVKNAYIFSLHKNKQKNVNTKNQEKSIKKN